MSNHVAGRRRRRVVVGIALLGVAMLLVGSFVSAAGAKTQSVYPPPVAAPTEAVNEFGIQFTQGHISLPGRSTGACSKVAQCKPPEQYTAIAPGAVSFEVNTTGASSTLFSIRGAGKHKVVSGSSFRFSATLTPGRHVLNARSKTSSGRVDDRLTIWVMPDPYSTTTVSTTPLTSSPTSVNTPTTPFINPPTTVTPTTATPTSVPLQWRSWTLLYGDTGLNMHDVFSNEGANHFIFADIRPAPVGVPHIHIISLPDNHEIVDYPASPSAGSVAVLCVNVATTYQLKITIDGSEVDSALLHLSQDHGQGAGC